jgi:hypothetical protein
MVTVNLKLDDDLVEILADTRQPIDDAALEMIVLELYRRGKLSSGRSAEILRMTHVGFIQHASDLEIPYLRLSADSVDSDIETGRSL